LKHVTGFSLLARLLVSVTSALVRDQSEIKKHVNMILVCVNGYGFDLVAGVIDLGTCSRGLQFGSFISPILCLVQRCHNF